MPLGLIFMFVVDAMSPVKEDATSNEMRVNNSFEHRLWYSSIGINAST